MKRMIEQNDLLKFRYTFFFLIWESDLFISQNTIMNINEYPILEMEFCKLLKLKDASHMCVGDHVQRGGNIQLKFKKNINRLKTLG